MSKTPAGGGKQIRRQPILDDDDDDVDEASFNSDESEVDDEYEESKPKGKAKQKPKVKAKPKSKPKAKPKAKAKEKKELTKKKDEPEEEIFGDDDVSSHDETELDMSNVKGLIKDDADKKYLDSLPELDREAILAERFENLKDEQDMKKAIREMK